MITGRYWSAWWYNGYLYGAAVASGGFASPQGNGGGPVSGSPLFASRPSALRAASEEHVEP